MLSVSFKKAVMFSFIGHIALFSIFSFSFGAKLKGLDYSQVYFWGDILNKTELSSRNCVAWEARKDLRLATSRSYVAALDKENRPLLTQGYYLKPASSFSFSREKLPFIRIDNAQFSGQRKDSPAIMFYPYLPYHFPLYFKDRQVAHIELMFNIAADEKRNSIIVKRKISSGNLEADLLGMRYISHYLFLQQAHFPSNSWQKVKIDLSTKDAAGR